MSDAVQYVLLLFVAKNENPVEPVTVKKKKSLKGTIYKKYDMMSVFSSKIQAVWKMEVA